MLRGFYTATSGMMAQQRRQEVLSNNMTNMLTPGYKQDQTSLRAFPELLIHRMENRTLPNVERTSVPSMTEIGAINTGVYVQETMPDFVQGTLSETGLPTDMAIVQGETPDEAGSIFFMVQNENGDVRYTRNGNFTIDGNGNVTTNQGYYVLDTDGNTIDTGGQAFTVAPDGTMQVADDEIPLAISYTANANQLVKNGNDLFELAEDGEALADARDVAGLQFSIQQHHLENANVDAAQTMSEMMQAYRVFEANQKVVQQYDRSLDLAANQIGKLG